jgi:hypothetical protein
LRGFFHKSKIIEGGPSLRFLQGCAYHALKLKPPRSKPHNNHELRLSPFIDYRYSRASLCMVLELFLDVIEKGHEAKVHMELLMAMEQGEPGIVRRKVHFGFLIPSDHYDVLHHTSGRLAREFGQFKTVTVKMDGMNIVAGIAHAKAVAFALLQVK